MFYSPAGLLSFFLHACCWSEPVGLFTHLKFRACFHLHAGWKTFASLERSQMWWKIQVADIHLTQFIHFCFSCSSKGGAVIKYMWNEKDLTQPLKLKSALFDLEIGIYRDFFFIIIFFCTDAHHRVDLCQIRRETPQLEASQRRTNSCEIASSGTV